MEKTAYWFVFGKLIVKSRSFGGRQYVHGNLSFLQKIQRLARDLKAFGHSARKHDHRGAVIQQFLHIGNLNARLMTGLRLAPVPISRAIGEKLRILVGLTFSFHLETPPGNVIDSRRTTSTLHDKKFVRCWGPGCPQAQPTPADTTAS